MWKKIALSGAVAAAVIGAGTASMALTSGTTSNTVPGTPVAAGQPATGGGKDLGPLRRLARAQAVLHGTVVTKNPKTGDIVTHDVSHGTVTDVSATSITVKPADNTTQTFVVNSGTKVRQRTSDTKGKGTDSTISAVKDGDEVYVAGTGTSPVTATVIVDIKK